MKNLTRLSFFLFITILCVSIVTAEERAPHGLVYVKPEAFSPSAYNFFHPINTNARKKKPETKTQEPCSASSSKCSPMSVTAQSEEATQIHENKSSSLSTEEDNNVSKNIGAGGIAGILFGIVFVVLLGMSMYHFRVTRSNNLGKSNNFIQPSLSA
ncbi:hypothetical protein HN51_019185 [Arachis hypogaea]|uniref:Transmembrane protein n=1 Tax=Arachis hypogaea TaxID=3818 RepID=A0A445BW43_ARAHY|nr:uncharacterized protein DS421_8g236380 [Arachis hypogaea]RYR42872.1 hypothetical protein Ahy_A08g039305 [Arachis hypogaea]